MKTTLNISDVVMKQLKEEAARRGTTMSELVEAALRMAFEKGHKTADLPPLPSFESGGALVDLSNRDLLYERMERA